jgi:deoxyribodipyrimidine photo-lyase
MSAIEQRKWEVRAGEPGPGPVIYWMQREQRAADNFGLLYAQKKGRELQRPLCVVFCLADSFLGAGLRQFAFMLQGLEEAAEKLQGKNIPFFLLRGDPGKEIPRFVKKCQAAHLVSDFNPLRLPRSWQKKVARAVTVPFDEIDSHNIVPCRIASEKQEYAAYTFRPKIHKLLPGFLENPPTLKKHPHSWPDKVPAVDWKKALASLKVDSSIGEIDWLTPGEKAARAHLKKFIQEKLARYPEDRNDPNLDGQSNLSPYLHFGHLSPLRAALEVKNSNAPKEAKEAFLEELIVRRELSDNFCFHQPKYDRVEGFPQWAQKNAAQHRDDRREYLYTPKQLEAAETHDDLWNAAQTELVKMGTIPGYLRMYWGKKILEWTKSPEKALAAALDLNDRYQLDGRDPNGYAGVAWSIGGVHDRPWPSRKVFGKVRYMNYNGCRRKFNVKAYIAKASARNQ